MAIRGIRLDVCWIGRRAGVIDEWAVDLGGVRAGEKGAEVTVAKGVTRESEPVEAATAIVNPKNVAKKERLVLNDRSTERPAVIIVSSAREWTGWGCLFAIEVATGSQR